MKLRGEAASKIRATDSEYRATGGWKTRAATYQLRLEKGHRTWETPAVSELLYMDKGRVTLPKESRERHGLGDGSTLLFLETKSGAMVLKPVKETPELNLIEHLKKFKGVEIPDFKGHCPPRV